MSFGVTGCGAAGSSGNRNSTASRGASVNFRIGVASTDAIISGLAVLSADALSLAIRGGLAWLSATCESVAGGNVVDSGTCESGAF